MPDLIVYVDGFNLYHGLRARFGRRALWLDLVALSESLRPHSRLVAVRYFTAPVLDDPDGASRQDVYQKALLSRGRGVLTITQGRYQRKTARCRSCGARWTRYEEKETDVNIATTMVADTADRLMDDALVLSADSDLVPAVRTARRLDPGLFVAAAFPPRRFSAEMQALMPASFHIRPSKITGNQLPDVVAVADADADGRRYRRPATWR